MSDQPTESGDQQQQPADQGGPPPPTNQAQATPPELPQPPTEDSAHARAVRRPFRIVALAVAMVVIAATSAVAGYLWVVRGSDETLISKVPADFDMFVTVYLDPSAAQKRNLENIVGKFPALGSGEVLSDNVDAALRGALTSFGLGSQDVRPWLGSQVAFAMDLPSLSSSLSQPRLAVLVDVSDEAKAEAALAKVRENAGTWQDVQHSGVTVWTGQDITGSPTAMAIVDGTLVLAPSQGTVNDVIDAALGDSPSLTSSERFTETVALLPEDRLALFYLDFESVIRTLSGTRAFVTGQLGSSDMATLESLKGMGMTLSAQSQGLALDSAMVTDPSKLSEEQRASLGGPEKLNPLLEWVPQDAYFVTAEPNLDQVLQQLADQIGRQTPDAALGLELMGLTGEHGLIASMTGDAVVEVGPGSVAPYPAGAIMFGTDDETSVEEAFSRLAPQVASTLAGDVARVNAKGKVHVVKTPPPEWDSTLYGEVTIHYLPVKDTAKAGVAISYAVTDGVAIIASSPDEVERLIDTHAGGTPITASPSFSKATEQVGGPEGSIVYLNVAGVLSAVRDAIPPDERSVFDLTVAPNLDPISAIAVGGEGGETHATSRIFIVIE